MNINKLFIAGISFIAATSASATMRMDLENQQPLEIIQSSLNLAYEIPQAECVGAILIKDVKNDKPVLATGVAIDQYTVISAAHVKNLMDENKNNITFALCNDAFAKDIKHVQINEVIVHPQYTVNPNPFLNTVISCDDFKKFYCDETPLEQLKDLNFEDLQNTNRYKNFYYSGVDLAILKLVTPLPENLAYPEFLDEKIEMKSQYGVFLGFGALQLSSIDKGPISFLTAGSNKHALNCKISHSHITHNPILYGKYETFLINGDESFIPNTTMMSTEGIPTQGDGGGPLFVEKKGQYYLAGNLSTNYAPFTDVVPQQNLRQFFKDIKMPVYPTWHALRGENLTWVKENMEKK